MAGGLPLAPVDVTMKRPLWRCFLQSACETRSSTWPKSTVGGETARPQINSEGVKVMKVKRSKAPDYICPILRVVTLSKKASGDAMGVHGGECLGNECMWWWPDHGEKGLCGLGCKKEA